MEETLIRNPTHTSQTQKKSPTHRSEPNPGRRTRKGTKKPRAETRIDDWYEDADVDGKIAELQRIVPGGEALAVDELFEETAGYIMGLQCQIKAMKALAGFLQGLEKGC